MLAIVPLSGFLFQKVEKVLATLDLADALRAAGLEPRTRAIDRLAAAHDASPYVLEPRVVVAARDRDEVAAALGVSRATGVPVTFRSGGTSLSGQSGGAHLLLDTRRHFRAVHPLDGGARVRVEPGATVRAVNARLARLGWRLGPDPASEVACTIGGVVANNSSGMTCGTHANTYRTLESSVLVLPSGTVVDSAVPDADELLRAAEPELHAGLLALRDRVRADPASVARITELFALKNTLGYGVNAFLDFDRAVDILEHLVVGSEGTLAFVAEATFRTLPVAPHAATGFLVFADLAAAMAALPALVAAGFAAIELLDATSLRVAQRDPEAPADLAALAVVEHAALLVEFQEADAAVLEERVAAAAPLIATLPVRGSAEVSRDPARRAALWHLRKGLFTLVAGARPPGTSALLEDIAVPVARLRETCEALAALFDRHGYADAVIFGHARDGNIHFLICERFDDAAGLERYAAFTEDLVDLVLAQGGTLKAEHGTGRAMAPFVERQYGPELYDVMRQVKRLVDPAGLLNPGVLIADDPRGHLAHLASAPTVEPEVDACVECGYCESVCPSRDLTLTPRERIVVRREMAAAEVRGDDALLAELRRDYGYGAVETCAVDGMCQTACPVLINTGDLVRRLRSETARGPVAAGWEAAARHWGPVTRLGSLALSVADAVPAALPRLATDLGRALLGADSVPRYSSDLPAGGRARPRRTDPDPFAILFPSCTTQLFGATDGDGVSAALGRLVDRAGIAVATPDDLPSLCCGTPWKSKGLTDGYALMRDRVAASLRRATRDGELPVVVDASSCTEGLEVLIEAAGATGIRVVDAVAFVADEVLPRLPAARRIPTLMLHPTCSSERLGLGSALRRVAEAVAVDARVPDDWGCCGFAGDRGMLHPELTAAATAPEAAAVRALGSAAHASLNRTCELGMSRATGEDYRHVLELLDEVTRPAGARG